MTRANRCLPCWNGVERRVTNAPMGLVERLEVATAALDIRVALYPLGRKDAANESVDAQAWFRSPGDELQGEIAWRGSRMPWYRGEVWLKAEAAYFLGRAVCRDYGV